jgi:hypothetical protein
MAKRPPNTPRKEVGEGLSESYAAQDDEYVKDGDRTLRKGPFSIRPLDLEMKIGGEFRYQRVVNHCFPCR